MLMVKLHCLDGSEMIVIRFVILCDLIVFLCLCGTVFARV